MWALAPLSVLAVVALAAGGTAHAQNVTVSTVELDFEIPDGLATTYRLAVSCTADVSVHGLDLYVPRNDPTDHYQIAASSILMDGAPVDHEGYDPGNAHLWASVVGNETVTLLEDHPLQLADSGLLVIPVVVSDNSPGLSVHSRVAMTYESETPAVCTLGNFGGPVQVGIVSSVGDRDSGFEVETLIAINLGLQDFNAHLAKIGEGWRLEPVIRDTDARGTTLSEEVADLRASDVNLILGPPISGRLATISNYISDNGMVLISCCANAHTLSAQENGIFRTLPNTEDMGVAAAEYILGTGIDVLLTVWADNAWSRDYAAAVMDEFAALGGVVHDGLEYQGTRGLDDTIQDELLPLVVQYGHERVAVFAAPGNLYPFYAAMADNDNLQQVRWFSTLNPILDERLLEDVAISEFLDATSFVALQPQTSADQSTEELRQRIADHAGRTGNANILAAYDSAWILGLAILEAQSDDPLRIREAIPAVASSHDGLVESVGMNANGDLVSRTYEAWTVLNGQWVLLDSPTPVQ